MRIVCVHMIDSCESMALCTDIDSRGAAELVYQSVTDKSALIDLQVLL